LGAIHKKPTNNQVRLEKRKILGWEFLEFGVGSCEGKGREREREREREEPCMH
jgi:hypothetical protein